MARVDKIKADYEAKQKKTSTQAIIAPVESPVSKAVTRIKDNLKEYARLRSDLLKDFLFLEENQEQVKRETGKLFGDFIKEDLGISAPYFYQQLKAYKLCLEYGKPEAFDTTDTKVLLQIARVENKKNRRKLFDAAPSLTREKLKEELARVRRTNYVDKTGASAGNQSLVIDADFTVQDAENSPPDVPGTTQRGADLPGIDQSRAVILTQRERELLRYVLERYAPEFDESRTTAEDRAEHLSAIAAILEKL